MFPKWLTKLWKSQEPPILDPIDKYQLYRQKNPKDDGVELSKLLFDVATFTALDLQVDDRFTIFVKSRYSNIDNLVYAFRQSNSNMLENQRIEYGAIGTSHYHMPLDSFLLSNERFVVECDQAVTSLRQCFDLYLEQLSILEKENPTSASYYKRVYALYIEELNGLLRSMLRLT